MVGGREDEEDFPQLRAPGPRLFLTKLRYPGVVELMMVYSSSSFCSNLKKNTRTKGLGELKKQPVFSLNENYLKTLRDMFGFFQKKKKIIKARNKDANDSSFINDTRRHTHAT